MEQEKGCCHISIWLHQSSLPDVVYYSSSDGNQFKARPDVEWRTAVPSSKRKKLKSFQSKMSKKIGLVSNLSKLPICSGQFFAPYHLRDGKLMGQYGIVFGLGK